MIAAIAITLTLICGPGLLRSPVKKAVIADADQIPENENK